MNNLDAISLQFSQTGQVLLAICLAFVMFGVSLELEIKDFAAVSKRPKSLWLGLGVQYLVLPAITYLLIAWLQPSQSLALGMVLLAACPSGSISNYITHLSKGNIALSVSITTLSTALSMFTTPLLFSFWGKLVVGKDIVFAIPFTEIALHILLLLALPLGAAFYCKNHFPKWASRIQLPIRRISAVVLFGFIIIAFASNFQIFIENIQYVAFLVFVQDSIAFFIGYFSAKIAQLPEGDCRSVAIETGIRNSGLGLVLVFTFFPNWGGMALIVAWWGVWHIVSGLVLSRYWQQRQRA